MEQQKSIFPLYKSPKKLPIPFNNVFADKGRISSWGGLVDDNFTTYNTKYRIGELYDVYCVAIEKKPLAAMNFSVSGKIYIKKQFEENNFDKKLYYEVIEFLNTTKVMSISWKGKSDNYLSDIFYDHQIKNSELNAFKLILILHTDYYDINEMEFHIAIGCLLGYSECRIYGYILRNLDYSKDFDIDNFIKKTITKVHLFEVDKKFVLNNYPIEKRQGLSLN